MLGPEAVEAGAARSVVVISDSTVAGLYGQRAVDSLAGAGLNVEIIDFPAGERSKTLSTYGQVMDRLFGICPAIDRDCLIVALGGGVTGDLAGFAAATALRGLRWVQCPTTLLADVDASVGGKTGLDHAAGKNLIGAFYQPAGVIVDVGTLETLSEEDLRSGLAECVKHGVIRQANLLDLIEGNVEKIFARDAAVMIDLIARNVAVKAAVVSADERESGERAHLNFGHTIGHAIEVFVGYGRITHGQAVSLGMIAADGMAVRRGLLEQEASARIAGLLDRLGLPTRQSGLDADAILSIMAHDKKARAGKIRMVLPSALGTVDVHDDVTEKEIREALASLQQ